MKEKFIPVGLITVKDERDSGGFLLNITWLKFLQVIMFASLKRKGT